MNRTIVRLGGALVASTVLLLPTTAWAHVTVSSPDAAREGYGKVVVRVPNESDRASTTELRLTLPKDAPFAFLTTQAKPGWTATVQEAKLDRPTKVGDATLTEAPRTITWKTTGKGIGPGQFDEFAFSGGPFPDTESITFSARQVYSDGEVSDWSEVQKGDEEPEKPAPVLTLLPASEDGHGGSHGAAADDAKAASTDASDDTLARVGAGAALVVALAALVLALRRKGTRA